MRILVLHGPNLGLLGRRRPEIYGTTTLDAIDALLQKAAGRDGHDIRCAQHDDELGLLQAIHSAPAAADGIIINPGALGHTSIALRDAIEAVEIPTVEVHLSNIYAREGFRQNSVISAVCRGVVSGFGPHSYVAGLHALIATMEEDR